MYEDLYCALTYKTKIVPLFISTAYLLQRCGLCCTFLLFHIMCFGFTNHTAGLSKAIGCNKYREPVCVSVIVQLSFPGLM